MSTQKTVRKGEPKATSQRRGSPVSIAGSASYKKMKSNLENKLRLAQREIQGLKKQLQNATKKQQIIIQRSNKKERVLKSSFAKKQRHFQQNFKKRLTSMERKWQNELNSKINDVKQVAFKQGIQESERCVREASKKFSSALKLPNSTKRPLGKKTRAPRKISSTASKRSGCKRVA